jgi:hypothetical protein
MMSMSGLSRGMVLAALNPSCDRWAAESDLPILKSLFIRVHPRPE